jgi:hypothetical protein
MMFNVEIGDIKGVAPRVAFALIGAASAAYVAMRGARAVYPVLACPRFHLRAKLRFDDEADADAHVRRLVHGTDARPVNLRMTVRRVEVDGGYGVDVRADGTSTGDDDVGFWRPRGAGAWHVERHRLRYESTSGLG